MTTTPKWQKAVVRFAPGSSAGIGPMAVHEGDIIWVHYGPPKKLVGIQHEPNGDNYISPPTLGYRRLNGSLIRAKNVELLPEFLDEEGQPWQSSQ